MTSPQTTEIQKLLEKEAKTPHQIECIVFNAEELMFKNSDKFTEAYNIVYNGKWVPLDFIKPKLEAFIRNHDVSREKLRNLIEEFPKVEESVDFTDCHGRHHFSYNKIDVDKWLGKLLAKKGDLKQ